MENSRCSVPKAPSWQSVVASHQHDWFSRFVMGGDLFYNTHIMAIDYIPCHIGWFDFGQGIHYFSRLWSWILF